MRNKLVIALIMKKVIPLSPILKICLLCFFITACDTPSSPPINNFKSKDTHPPLDLSIDNIAIESLQDNDATFLNDKIFAEKNSELFKILSKEKPDPNIDISGKIFTNDEKIKNKEYLDSIEGVQITIEGKFELD